MKKEYFDIKKEEKEKFKDFIEKHSDLKIKNIYYENIFLEIICSTTENEFLLFSLQKKSYDFISYSLKEFMDIMHNEKQTNSVFKEYLFGQKFLIQYLEKNEYKIEKDDRLLIKKDLLNTNYFDEKTFKIVKRNVFLEKCNIL